MVNVKRSIQRVNKSLQLLEGLGEPEKPRKLCHRHASLAKAHLRGGDAASASFLRNALQEIGKQDGFVADECLTENCLAECGK